MGQTQTYEGSFYCQVFNVNDDGTESMLIEDPTNYFYRIDENSWYSINMLVEQHLLKNFRNLRLNGLEHGFGGDDNNGFVYYSSFTDINSIPSMFFTITQPNKIIYKLDKFEIGPEKYRMDFIKEHNE